MNVRIPKLVNSFWFQLFRFLDKIVAPKGTAGKKFPQNPLWVSNNVKLLRSQKSFLISIKINFQTVALRKRKSWNFYEIHHDNLEGPFELKNVTAWLSFHWFFTVTDGVKIRTVPKVDLKSLAFHTTNIPPKNSVLPSSVLLLRNLAILADTEYTYEFQVETIINPKY